MKHIKPEDEELYENLEEALDDLHAEGVTFTRDDSGIWFAKTKIDHGRWSTGVWWQLTDGDDDDSALADHLEALLDRARPLGAA